MSAIDDLAATQSSNPDPVEAAELLAVLLGLPSVGLSIRSARIVGRGSKASADLYLSDGSCVTFESLRDFANPTRLAIEIAATTGATPRLKAPQAIRALSLLRAVSEHRETVTTDDLAVEWGTTYLQAAMPLDVDMDVQAQRWRAFSHLDGIDPYSTARAEGGTLAANSTVLVHTTGERLVRCGWFRDYVKRDDPTVSPQEIGHRMERVGWQRRGRTGRVKASQPGGTGVLAWSFYVVPADWEMRA